MVNAVYFKGVTMFEKEAEEWVKENMDCCKTDNSVNQSIPYFDEEERCCAKSAFQDGAEFGYNKGNEWHYPSKGELPKTKKKVLVLLKDVEEPILDYYRQDGLWNYALEDEVLAWKEIVLPELKESE